MNTFYNRYVIKKISFLAIAAITLFSGCTKSDPYVPEIGALSIYNFSPSSGTFDFYITDTKVNTAAMPFGGGISYLQLYAGLYDVKFTIAGESESLYTYKDLPITKDNYATLYLTGTPGNLEGLYLSDNATEGSIKSAFVRFINLSPDAPALDLEIKDGAQIVTNKTYKSYSNFIEVDPSTVVLEIKDTSTGTVKHSFSSTTLHASHFYTIIARGLENPTTDLEKPFGGQIITHQDE